MPDDFDIMDPSLAQSDDGHIIGFGNGGKFGVETHHHHSHPQQQQQQQQQQHQQQQPQQQSDPVPVIGDYSEEYFTNGNVQLYNQREYLDDGNHSNPSATFEVDSEPRPPPYYRDQSYDTQTPRIRNPSTVLAAISDRSRSSQLAPADQHRLEKKRERNRIAASKCRQKKVDLIMALKSEVDKLKQENDALKQESSSLTNDLGEMKRQLQSHQQSGCKIHLGTSLGFVLGAPMINSNNSINAPSNNNQSHAKKGPTSHLSNGLVSGHQL
ncbi:hypothetical protein TCAL_12898 [Tigriopus californicus]|uniref:BZIP domain-containing protein n=1 Tax=Tigriopus californicus TaxID=6832 RepID=A0A553NU43_TIGCA|nr:transcription factor Jun-like [Tigriopus californicus]TRY68954.1 hypothetical protein TCAL_12898 [Tigriopus californicus]